MTQQAQHTPGPWLLDKIVSHNIRNIFTVYVKQFKDGSDFVRDIKDITEIQGLKGQDNIAELEANARLIAAAPDYYAACVDIPQIEDEETTDHYHLRVLRWFNQNAPRIVAANSKAEGK